MKDPCLTCGLVGSLNVLKVNCRRSSLNGSLTISSPSNWLSAVLGAGNGKPAISAVSALSVRQYRMTAAMHEIQQAEVSQLPVGGSGGFTAVDQALDSTCTSMLPSRLHC